MALTMAAAKAAGPRARAYKLFDGGGLFLHVAPTGTRTWRVKHRRGGREQLATLGRFPALSLAEARARRDALRANLGSTPSSLVVDNRQADTFEQVARAWHAHQAPRWSDSHAARVLAGLERHVFPRLGERPIGAIAAAELLAVLRPLEARGRGDAAKRLRQRLSAVFGYAIAHDLAAADPAARLGSALAGAGLARPMPALTDPAECRALLAACDHLAGAGKMIRLASRFLALTAVRLAAVRGMRWSEVHDLDGAAPLWIVPAARMKLTRAKKGDSRFDHAVPLSPQAVGVLRAAAKLQFGDANLHARNIPGNIPDALVFPIGAGALRALYARTPFAGRHVPHGWRASFATILNEDLGPQWRGDIDRALAHSPKDKVEAAYNRAQLLDRRRALFARWGELLGP